MEGFEAQAVLLPQWVQIWMNVLVTSVMICIMITLAFPGARKTGLIALVLTIMAFGSTIWLHGQFGMVRLLGLGHIVFWTPLVVVIAMRLRRGAVPIFPKIALSVMALVIVAALVFDYFDLFRWIAGERGSIV